jgi:hypothetical protein
MLVQAGSRSIATCFSVRSARVSRNGPGGERREGLDSAAGHFGSCLPGSQVGAAAEKEAGSVIVSQRSCSRPHAAQTGYAALRRRRAQAEAASKPGLRPADDVAIRAYAEMGLQLDAAAVP